MPFTKVQKRPLDPEISFTHPSRPKFHHQYTNDRIREGSGRPPSFSMSTNIKKGRKSVFKEVGLDSDEPIHGYPQGKEFGETTDQASSTSTRVSVIRHNHSKSDDGSKERKRLRTQDYDENEAQSPRSPPTSPSSSKSNKPWYAKLAPGRRPRIRSAASAPPSTMPGLSRLTTTALLIAVVLPGFSYYNGRGQVSLAGADAGVVHYRAELVDHTLGTRADSPTQVCKRWGHQTAQLNGTLYIYGGQAKTSSDQTTNTWNNNLLSLDLTKSWDITSPALRGLPQPSGPPTVSLGYLWNDYNNLYLYGGEFPDNPFVEPAPVSTWQYAIGSQTWTEYPNPRTSAGNNSNSGDVPLQRSAEGAGLSVPELGLSWYFGGHLDLSTTPGWSNQIERVYLKSLLEFTHPGYTNDGVQSLADGSGAGEGGVYRNITEGGLQVNTAFSERADGVLVFVPGWGEKGVLIGLAGGTADTFTNDLSTLDVYDIARSEWYHQQTSGEPPSVRVNPCAVIASAPDASSFQIYLYGGQNLQPYKEQIQYSDMYILSIPAFTWIKVPQSGTNIPPARAGHTCSLRDGQIVVVGGYIGTTTPCESPGVFVFDATSLKWTSKFTARQHAADLDPENSVLGNSNGYQVPAVVASVIGGGSTGGATATTPAAGPATGGPFATGKSPVFTITASGSTATVTQWGPGATATGGASSSPPPTGTGNNNNDTNDNNAADDRRPELIAAGIIAGFAGLLAAYLGYCAWLYRRQVRAYKSHLAVANRYSPAGASTGGLSGGLAAFFGGVGRKGGGSKNSKNSAVVAAAGDEKPWSRGRASHYERNNQSTSTVDSVGGYWKRAATEPKLFFEGAGEGSGSNEPTPGSGYSYSSGHPSQGYTGPYPAARPAGWWDGISGEVSGSGSGSGGSGSGITPSSRRSGQAASSTRQHASMEMSLSPGPRRSRSRESGSSTEALLDGQEPSFFSVVMGPRRALRVVNGLEGDGNGNSNNNGNEEGHGGS
ncbi:hypothetical protein B0T17DRAFT_613323 [Bombardia bombarda]|uniref:Kelch repeat-containing protein n=1 Tax=Bombardia bombarda TaxID=252184 RepID=A0AA39XM78_9PEZI|nr:hypothetical protein B0T17DRAFT_613323 [Bombardia bombarda]